MDAVKFVMSMSRICQNNNCGNCALSSFCGKACYGRTKEDAEKAMTIVEEWMKAHSVKTRQSELLKMFPNTPLGCDSGVITMCPANFDASVCKQGVSCDDCCREFWLEEID